jgi:hypothetical protein
MPPLGTDAQDLSLCLPNGVWSCSANGCRGPSGQIDITGGRVSSVTIETALSTGSALAAYSKAVADIEATAGPPDQSQTSPSLTSQGLRAGARWVGADSVCVVVDTTSPGNPDLLIVQCALASAFPTHAFHP